jgi:hypothetical protein
MATKNMFEELLEHIVNGEQAKAEELFHTIIVSKSREIYENIIESDLEDEEDMDEATESDEEEMDESTKDDEEEMDEDFGFGEEGGDETDDMTHDMEEPEHDADDSEMDDMDGDEDGEDEGSVDDRVDDLEDALADLKAEFDALMRDEKNEPDHHDGVDDPDFSNVDDDEEDESMMPAFEEEIEEIDLSPTAMMREYVDKVGEPYKQDMNSPKGRPVGAGSGEFVKDGETNPKSVVAKKNDMGGTTANIAKGGTGSEKGTTGGLLAPTTKPQDGGNVNVPGAKNATKLKPVTKGHGSEKKGAGEVSGINKTSLFK